MPNKQQPKEDELDHDQDRGLSPDPQCSPNLDCTSPQIYSPPKKSLPITIIKFMPISMLKSCFLENGRGGSSTLLLISQISPDPKLILLLT